MNPENMTPEQMAAVAKQQCIFCQIASGKVASRKIYEDDKVVGVLDINPANPGHVLLITKEHYVVMPQIPDDVVTHIGMVAKGISHAVLRALKAQGTTIFAANGVAAGQRAQHFMLHIIPRMESDGITIDYPEHKISDADYKKILTALKKGVAKAFGKEAEEGPEEEAEKAEDETKEEKETEEKTIEAEEIPEKEPERDEEAEDEKTEEDKGDEAPEQDKDDEEDEGEKEEDKEEDEEPEEDKDKEEDEREKEEPEGDEEGGRGKLDQIADLLTK